jgi:hypothetical protein
MIFPVGFGAALLPKTSNILLAIGASAIGLVLAPNPSNGLAALLFDPGKSNLVVSQGSSLLLVVATLLSPNACCQSVGFSSSNPRRSLT